MDSVKFEVKQALSDYDPSCRTQWLLKHICQATLTAVRIDIVYISWVFANEGRINIISINHEIMEI